MLHHGPTPLPSSLFNRLDVHGAIVRELTAGNRLLSRRYDGEVLAADVDAVVQWALPLVRKDAPAVREEVVLARKDWRGCAP